MEYKEESCADFASTKQLIRTAAKSVLTRKLYWIEHQSRCVAAIMKDRVENHVKQSEQASVGYQALEYIFFLF